MTFAVAIGPIIVILILILKMDRYSSEPKSVLLKAYFLGILTVMPALILEKFLLLFLKMGISTESIWFAFIDAFVVAGLIEEGMKFVIIYVFLLKHKEFNEMIDGIVYAVLISLGFATIENLMYSLTGGMEVAVARAVTSVPAHIVFGILMGYYLGVGKFITPTINRKLLLIGFILPVLLHGFYDFILTARIKILILIFFPYLSFLIFYVYKKTKRLSLISRHKNVFHKKKKFVRRRENRKLVKDNTHE